MKTLWNFFSSTALTVVLAILICLDAVWGSLLSVNHRAFYQILDSSILLPRLFSFGTNNLSYTLWIYILIALITLFAINTFICTTDRVVSILRSKSPWQRLLPHIVHIGFLIALVGHLLGSSSGFKSAENILMQGESMEVPMNERLRIRLDNVDIKRKPGSREITAIKTKVTLFEDGSEILSDDIEINGPLIYKGIAFYHMTQGQMPMGLQLSVGGEPREVLFDGSFKGEGKDDIFTLGTLYPDFMIDNAGRPASRSAEFNNPYQEILSATGSRSYLNISRPGTSVTIDGVEILLNDYVMRKYAVLSINKDPGIWFIIAGSLVLTIGIILIFLFSGGRAELIRTRPKKRLTH